MVGDRLQIELSEYWFPTKSSAMRWVPMTHEFSLNHIAKGQQLSPAEIAATTGNTGQALSTLPPEVPRTIRRQMAQLLRPWPEGRYTPAYERSGGILNLLTPPWGEAQDEVWVTMLTDGGFRAGESPTGADRQAAYRDLEQRWNRSPHPFFAGLTPAQVMVGGGSQEYELAREFLERLADAFDGVGFESEGEALVNSLLLLRGWQVQPREDGRTAPEIIAAERDELLARRARALEAAARVA